MSSPIIRCENVGKKYHIRHNSGGARYTALRDVLASRAKGLFRRSQAASASTTSSEEFWALKDVSFEVQQGEVVGIIGKNGAGKSTLLKILSRITEPTTGRITLGGRVASLLEVGTGFHPELTGRENIYLNGAILGMSKAEIRTKFDEIVAFAEVEKFLDTPVKRYSSGMYVRLAFAVAAHLEPEILVVDEVLAVGDAQFQKKCLGKMQEVARGGRTVLFVSHNMAAVTSLCSRAILLERGVLALDDSPERVINGYMQESKRERGQAIRSSPRNGPHFSSVGLSRDLCNYGGLIDVDVELLSPVDASVAIEIEIHNQSGSPIVYTSTAPMHGSLIPLTANVPKAVRLTLGPLPLASGDYYIRLWLIKPWTENYHIFPDSLYFNVPTSDPGSSGFEFRQDYNRGAMTVPLQVGEPSAVFPAA